MTPLPRGVTITSMEADLEELVKRYVRAEYHARFNKVDPFTMIEALRDVREAVTGKRAWHEAGEALGCGGDREPKPKRPKIKKKVVKRK